MEIKTSFLDERRNDVVEALKAYNDALKTNDADKIRKAERTLRESEAEYAKQKAVEVYAECAKQPNPILYAIETFTYEILGHKDEKEDGVVVSATLDEHKARTIDLYRMCVAQKLDTNWANVAQNHCLTLLLAQCSKLGFSQNQMKAISKSYALDKKARELREAQSDKSKKNPISKGSMLDELQNVVDAVMKAAGITDNKYRANNHDINYFCALFCRKGKQSLTVAASNPAYYRRILMDVLHRIVCGLQYGVEFDILNKDGKRETGCIYAEEKQASATKSTSAAKQDNASKPGATEKPGTNEKVA